MPPSKRPIYGEAIRASFGAHEAHDAALAVLGVQLDRASVEITAALNHTSTRLRVFKSRNLTPADEVEGCEHYTLSMNYEQLGKSLWSKPIAVVLISLSGFPITFRYGVGSSAVAKTSQQVPAALVKVLSCARTSDVVRKLVKFAVGKESAPTEQNPLPEDPTT